MKETVTYTGVSVTASLSAFVSDSINEIAIWLFVMFFIVIVDLLMKIYKIIKRKDEKFRWTKGMRDTMAKMATYFAFVVTAVFLQNASAIDELAKYCILVIIGGEAISILGNYCKAHGYVLDQNGVINAISDKFNIPEDLIQKEEER